MKKQRDAPSPIARDQLWALAGSGGGKRADLLRIFSPTGVPDRCKPARHVYPPEFELACLRERTSMDILARAVSSRHQPSVLIQRHLPSHETHNRVVDDLCRARVPLTATIYILAGVGGFRDYGEDVERERERLLLGG